MRLYRVLIACSCFVISSCGSSRGSLPEQPTHYLKITMEQSKAGGFNEVVDNYLVIKEKTGLSNNEIKRFYAISGSNETILKIDMASMPCSILLKKHKPSPTGDLWLMTDISCDESN
ncbi:hypothetical protein [Xenorhabdus bovienii]|uniref:hypothetical protein n=1 Tax=Xenorhabdus bovienii TaxID=40576 RepID=UPI00237C7371|nr:hypothetical protein [Xenorhabdus bovienii]MDE1491736.1 hypothetical protein [Xenorhabdus bovienii]